MTTCSLGIDLSNFDQTLKLDQTRINWPTWPVFLNFCKFLSSTLILSSCNQLLFRHFFIWIKFYNYGLKVVLAQFILFYLFLCFWLHSSVDLSRAEGFFGRTLLYGYELSPSFPLQTLIIVSYERDTLDKMMMSKILTFSYLLIINLWLVG